LVHLHSADPSFMGTTIFMLLARLARVKVLLHMQSTDWDEFYTDVSLMKKIITRIGFSSASVVVVLYSLWVKKIKAICPQAEVMVIRNLIHRLSPPNPEEVRNAKQRLELTDEHFVVVAVGTVGKRKGSFEIVKALPEMVREEPLIRLIFVGGEEEPGEMAQLVQQIGKHGLEPWVILTDEIKRDEVPLYLAVADVFLLPSFVEGMPVAIIEAMCLGLPVISTRVAAIPDMIEEGESGLLIDPGAPDEIAGAVLALRKDAGLRQRLAAGGLRAFDERFEFSRGIEEIRRLYHRISSARDPGPN
jgi:glycosyltransferase involved in cell wall biosynthesis